MGEFCKSCADARKGAPVPYDDLDPEMVGLVRAINTIPGMRTLDSCFGHPGSGNSKKSHQAHAYVGLMPMDVDKFNQFWSDFFGKYAGKREVKDGFIQFSVVDYPYEHHPLTRLHIDCEHDPAIDPRGVQEKKDAMKFLQGYIEHYLAHVLRP